jgi:hypothetical protein
MSSTSFEERRTDPEELAPYTPTEETYVMTEMNKAQQKIDILTAAMKRMSAEFLKYGSRPWAVALIDETLAACEALDKE